MLLSDAGQIGRKTEAQGTGFQGAGAFVSQRRTVKPAAHADLMLRESISKRLTIDPRAAKRDNAGLMISADGETFAVCALQLPDR